MLVRALVRMLVHVPALVRVLVLVPVLVLVLVPVLVLVIVPMPMHMLMLMPIRSLQHPHPSWASFYSKEVTVAQICQAVKEA